MRDQEFEKWLRNKYPNPNSWRTFRSETRRIFRHKGNLDDIYERDGFQALYESFSHSKHEGVLPPDDIPHDAAPYVTADFRKQCLKLYAQFCQENPRGSHLRLLPDEITQPNELNELSASEGRELLRLHRIHERSHGLVARKKRSVASESGRLVCEACDFDFASAYGTRGEGFAECHHIHPISQSPPGRRTRLSELAIVCANCHRMLHLRPWVSVAELRELVQSRRR